MGDRLEDGTGRLIRPGTDRDVAFMAALGASAFARFGDYDPIIREFLSRDDVTSWVAEAAGERVGFALVERPAILPGFADLVAIAVDARHRRQGIGRDLLAEVVADSERRGEPVLALTVADDNPAAIALFHQWGFRKVPGNVGRYAGGQRSRRMVRTPAEGAA